MTSLSKGAGTAALPDSLFPSGYFAKVPAEVLAPLAHEGPSAMSHAEFRVFVALCRFRGPTRIVNPTRMTLERMTGLTPNNISRSTRSLQAKGWLTIHYVEGRKAREVENYELHLSTSDHRVAKGTVRPKGASESFREGVEPTMSHGAPDEMLNDYFSACDEADVNSLADDELEALLEVVEVV